MFASKYKHYTKPEATPLHYKLYTIPRNTTIFNVRDSFRYRYHGCESVTFTFWRQTFTRTRATNDLPSSIRRNPTTGTWKSSTPSNGTAASTSVKWTQSQRSIWPYIWTLQVVVIVQNLTKIKKWKFDTEKPRNVCVRTHKLPFSFEISWCHSIAPHCAHISVFGFYVLFFCFVFFHFCFLFVLSSW